MPLNDGTQTRKVRVKVGREYQTVEVRIRPVDPSTAKLAIEEDPAPARVAPKPEGPPAK